MYYPVKLKRTLWTHTVHVADDISLHKASCLLCQRTITYFYHKSRKRY